MVHVLLTAPLGDLLIERVRSVDSSIVIDEATPALRSLIRGELSEDSSALPQAEADAARQLPPVEIIIGWGRFPASALRWAEKLRWIQAVSAGVERVDPQVFDQVVLTNGNGIAAEPIAEQVIGYVFALSRNLPQLLRRQIDHRWDRSMQAREVAGATMGIVGMGAIGTAVARRARGVGMRVIATRRSATERTPDLVADEVCPPSDLTYLLEQSDVVVLATPLTPETRGLIGAAQLATMRPGSFLINIARGAVVDETALIDSLRCGHLGGAALDVVTAEPLAPGSPLWDFENVIITPHVSVFTNKHAGRVADFVCDNLRRYLSGQPLRNIVDPSRGY